MSTHDRPSIAYPFPAKEGSKPTFDILPLVSIVIPAFNEAAIIASNVRKLFGYLHLLRSHYRWEVILINDGSTDGTAEIAAELSSEYPELRVLHHFTNFGLGQALKFAFRQSRGDYVISLDADLSYEPAHIGLLLNKIETSRAKLVLASPYMKGGTISNVPAVRRILSVCANRFLSFFAPGRLSTLTCMVRAYDGPFLRSLSLRATGMEIMPEVVYKSMILRARIDQVPANLDWGEAAQHRVGRFPAIKIFRHVIATILSGFIFKPFLFFVLPGLLLLLFSGYVNAWMIIHFVDAYGLASGQNGLDRASVAFAVAYQQSPHTFIVGLLTLMLSIQLIGLGILALQSKNYFEEMFYMGSTIGAVLSRSKKQEDPSRE